MIIKKWVTHVDPTQVNLGLRAKLALATMDGYRQRWELIGLKQNIWDTFFREVLPIFDCQIPV